MSSKQCIACGLLLITLVIPAVGGCAYPGGTQGCQDGQNHTIKAIWTVVPNDLISGRSWEMGVLREPELRRCLESPIKIPPDDRSLTEVVEKATGKTFVYLTSEDDPIKEFHGLVGYFTSKRVATAAGDERSTVTVGECLSCILDSLSESGGANIQAKYRGVFVSIVTEKYICIIRMPLRENTMFNMGANMENP